MHIAVQLFRAVKLTHAVLSLPLAYLPTACFQHLTLDKSLSTLAFFDPISSTPLALLRVDRSQSRKVRSSNHIELVERLSTLRSKYTLATDDLVVQLAILDMNIASPEYNDRYDLILIKFSRTWTRT